MRLTNVLKQTRTIEVDFAGEKVKIEYYLNVITPELLEKLDQYGKKAPLHQIEAVVKTWDVLDDDGNELKPNQENLPKMPMGFLIEVLESIDRDMQGWTKDEKKSSGGGS